MLESDRARDFGKGTGALSIRCFRKRASSSLTFDGMESLHLRMSLRMPSQNKRQTKGAQQAHVRNQHMYAPILGLRSRVIVFVGGDIYAVRMHLGNHVTRLTHQVLTRLKLRPRASTGVARGFDWALQLRY